MQNGGVVAKLNKCIVLISLKMSKENSGENLLDIGSFGIIRMGWSVSLIGLIAGGITNLVTISIMIS